MFEKMQPVMIDGVLRHQVYPGQNEKVMRVVGKIIRGMAVHRNMMQYVTDERVAAELLTDTIPEKYSKLLEEFYYVPNIAAILGREVRHKRLHSIWALKILEVPFIGNIYMEETGQ